jgi:hypothetical protein
MHLVLLLVGVVLAGAGIAMVRYALPIEEMSSVALFTSGIMAIVGALVIGALAVIARNLARIAERLEIQPLPVPPIAALERDEPTPRPVKAPMPAAAGAARPSFLGGWLGKGVVASARPSRTPAAQTPPTEAPATPSIDLAPLTRTPDAVAAPPAASASPSPPPVRPAVRPQVASNGAASTVYRSGVIDGMAYTLFMDGSIAAELPQGTVKFASVDDLQKHILGSR